VLLEGEAFLPPWLQYRYSARHALGLVYGVPPQSGLYHLQASTVQYCRPVSLSLTISVPGQEVQILIAFLLRLYDL
jgi:hypothetical protein